VKKLKIGIKSALGFCATNKAALFN